MILFAKKNFVKRLMLVLFSLLFLGCQTLRMQYESTIEMDKGENQKFTYVDSYDSETITSIQICERTVPKSYNYKPI